ncbi:MAG: ImmA/IrrE family metallo-endopeptidase [Nitrospinae bacterium]|nr:ImmA/IrrE family metallo-endopeptidase [Nitrospinota bacterium]
MTQNPYKQAQLFLEELGITSLPVNIEEVCQKQKISYSEFSMSPIDGISHFQPRTDKKLIVVNSDIREIGRKNFTAAHEIGHWCLDVNLMNGKPFICKKEEVGFQEYSAKSCEKLADEFASEFLMPRKLFKELMADCPPAWNEIERLSEHCKTSLLATAIKFMQLTEHFCVLVVNDKNGRISYFRPSRYFYQYIDMNSRKVKPESFAFKALNGGEVPTTFCLTKAENWLSDYGINPDPEILEWSLPLNSYGKVLTILWDETKQPAAFQGDKVSSLGDIWEPPTFKK